MRRLCPSSSESGKNSGTSSGGWKRRIRLGRAGIDKIGPGALIGLPTAGELTAIWLPNICYGCNSITGKAATCLLPTPASMYWRH